MQVETVTKGEVQCVLKWLANVGECPLWSATEQKLYWVDILEKKVHRFDPSTAANETFALPEIVTSIGLRAKGGLVLTLRKGFAFFDPRTGSLERVSEVEADQPQNRFNDGKCDPQGRFWAGTMDSAHWDQPKGHLFCLGEDHAVTCTQENVICGNGTGWSPDGKTMYFTESFRYTIFAFDFEPETGKLSNRRSFVEVDRTGGAFPDGLTVDSEGCVWTSIVGPGQIHRLDPHGELERIIQFPVPRATCSTFGGDDLKTLYVTSSYETLTPAQLKEAPLSGSLFAVATNVRGLPATPFAG
jgi:sugar lactone lactonase YvrE